RSDYKLNKMLFQGEIMDRKTSVDIEDRGYQFGDGIYEVIGVYNRMPMLMDEHLERLQRSAQEIQLKLPVSVAKLKSNLLELISLNDLQEGIIYLQVSRGVASRWHEFPSEDVPPVWLAYTREEKPMTYIEDHGATAVLTEDIRWLRCDIKTLNLLPNVVAKQKAVENDAFEAILHRGKTVTEASSSNVFIVKNGEIFTHPANNYILNGITRQRVLQLTEKLHVPVREQPFTVSDLLNADEVFVTATKLDIIPIIQVDNQMIGKGKPGVITRQIIGQFRQDINRLVNEPHLHQ